MFSIDCKSRKIGVNFHQNNTYVFLWAPFATTVRILVNEKNILSLEKQGMGYWFLQTNQIVPGDCYLFLMDGKAGLPDPASLSQLQGVHKCSAAYDLNNYQWSDQSWRNYKLSEYIIYEIHTGTFSEKGTFEGISEKLDYLLELGITAIELMPVASFPGKRNWGYDGVFPFSVHESYGGADELKKLIDICHQKKLAVIIDVVYNHFGPEGNYLSEFGPYFTDKYKTPWGKAINYDDAYCDGVRDFIIENALMWFRDFHADALRLDAVHAIKDFSATHILKDLRKHADELSVYTGKEYYLIAECDLNDPEFTNSPENGGLGMHAQWADEFHHALRVTAGEAEKGYYSDFKGINDLARAIKNGWVYTGQYSEYRKKKIGAPALSAGNHQFVVFSQNHDQIGNRMSGERSSVLYGFEISKLLATVVILSPFLPLLFMGEEWAETSPFLYFTDHSDTELNEAIIAGRKKEFKDMPGLDDFYDPAKEDTFLKSKLQWNLQVSEPHSTILSYYKKLIRIRKYYFMPELFLAGNTDTYEDEENKTLCVLRWNKNGTYLMAFNFSDEVREIVIPEMQNWKNLLDSAAEEWNGPGMSKLVSTNLLHLKPASASIFYSDNV